MMDRELQEKMTRGVEIFRAKRRRELGVEEFEPFYERVAKGRFKPDPRAIEAYDSMVKSLPMSPPGRR